MGWFSSEYDAKDLTKSGYSRGFAKWGAGHDKDWFKQQFKTAVAGNQDVNAELANFAKKELWKDDTVNKALQDLRQNISDASFSGKDGYRGLKQGPNITDFADIDGKPNALPQQPSSGNSLQSDVARGLEFLRGQRTP
ncbi:MAG TPA: hypothetical protein PKI93_01145 [Alphaproteobacteria bacterium]|nr:hypothetical protein [Alphaproteobacteria bacterium]HNS45049.1 hypothetical protein [Alphaproteobacteria bacterium]